MTRSVSIEYSFPEVEIVIAEFADFGVYSVTDEVECSGSRKEF